MTSSGLGNYDNIFIYTDYFLFMFMQTNTHGSIVGKVCRCGYWICFGDLSDRYILVSTSVPYGTLVCTSISQWKEKREKKWWWRNKRGRMKEKGRRKKRCRTRRKKRWERTWEEEGTWGNSVGSSMSKVFVKQRRWQWHRKAVALGSNSGGSDTVKQWQRWWQHHCMREKGSHSWALICFFF